jgi:hypothetical protein
MCVLRFRVGYTNFLNGDAFKFASLMDLEVQVLLI